MEQDTDALLDSVYKELLENTDIKVIEQQDEQSSLDTLLLSRDWGEDDQEILIGCYKAPDKPHLQAQHHRNWYALVGLLLTHPQWSAKQAVMSVVEATKEELTWQLHVKEYGKETLQGAVKETDEVEPVKGPAEG